MGDEVTLKIKTSFNDDFGEFQFVSYRTIYNLPSLLEDFVRIEGSSQISSR